MDKRQISIDYLLAKDAKTNKIKEVSEREQVTLEELMKARKLSLIKKPPNFRQVSIAELETEGADDNIHS